ncbi:MAG TPA: carboxymuconolactone decarboxylase family protein [Novimethylophilus sp.]|jgi:uncharacterized peroxidase-related enzyme|uniref:carboxymuconolactone decarboxylase family protein n=1 Tax=Novimethylophilus sp. TaxID=2137426 RepID=UPI002F41E8C5
MRFHIHNPDTAPEGSRETLTQLVQSYGFLPNLAGVLAESPAILKGYVAATSAFDSADTTLSPLERQIVMLAASVKNRCIYCAAAHGMLAGKHGLCPGEVDNMQQQRRLSDARLEALRHFTETIVEDRGRVSDVELEVFIKAGFTQAQILEVILGVAIKTLTNYAHHIAKPPLNEQFAGFSPHWASPA